MGAAELLGTSMEAAIVELGAPPRSVDIQHLACLSRGIHSSVQHLIQRQLGMPGSAVLRDEAKKLVALRLADLRNGADSSLVFRVVGEKKPALRPPTSVALFDLMSGLKRYHDTGQWPRFLHPVIRRSVHEGVAPVLASKAALQFTVSDRTDRITCPIDTATSTALAEAEEFEPGEPVVAVGHIVEKDIQKGRFRLQMKGRSLVVKTSRGRLLSDVDPFSWGRVEVTGTPMDERCSELELAPARSIREATGDQDDGILKGRVVAEVNKLPAFIAATDRIQSFSELQPGWDTYGALVPARRLHRAGLALLRDAFSVLLSYEIAPPQPFVAPTRSGGIQFEWEKHGRELELEITSPSQFHYLLVDNGEEREGEVTRWGAIRLIRWLATGEEP